MTLLDAAYLAQCLNYDPISGVFRWRLRPPEHFPRRRHHNSWNTRYAGKVAGCLNSVGYRHIGVDGVKLKEHHLAWVLTYGEPATEIDHIDGDRANNRIANLRVATRSENNANARLKKNNSSGHKGVCFDASKGKFLAYIGFNRHQKWLGYFDTLEEAAAARREAAVRLHGKFARHE